MTNNWAEEEFGLVELGDKRLNKRLLLLANNFIKSPESPINKACKDWSETKAAYRFFKNDISYKDIQRSHVKSTVERCKMDKKTLIIQDTSFFNYSSHKKTEGLCMLNRKPATDKYKEHISSGLAMHTAFAVTTEGLPLGIFEQEIYSRKPMPKVLKNGEEVINNHKIEIYKKDTNRWLRTLKKSSDLAKENELDIVTICDREADIYDFFLEAQKENTNILVRAKHDRKINRDSLHCKESGEKLWDYMNKQRSAGSIEINVPKKDKEPERTASLNVMFDHVNVWPNQNNARLKNEKLPALKLNVIYLKEKKSPNISKQIEWMLITNIEINNFDEATEKISWYCLRWRIEVFHKILKSGLKVEECRLSNADKLIRYLSLMSIIAWRIYWITLIARYKSTLTSKIILSDFEWKILFTRFNKKKEIPENAPTVDEVVRWIACLGGFLNRKSDGAPGIIYIWRGLKAFSEIIEGAEIARKLYG